MGLVEAVTRHNPCQTLKGQLATRTSTTVSCQCLGLVLRRLRYLAAFFHATLSLWGLFQQLFLLQHSTAKCCTCTNQYMVPRRQGTGDSKQTLSPAGRETMTATKTWSVMARDSNYNMLSRGLGTGDRQADRQTQHLQLPQVLLMTGDQGSE